MPTAVRTCRVCGKSYEACRTMSKTAGVFRWQEVACSPECGAEYLRRVTEARNPAPPAPKSVKARRRASPIVEAVKPAEPPVAEPVSEPENQAPVEAPVETPVENE